MSAVDEILESGRYTDRRGRSWRPNLGDNWVHLRGRKPRGELFYDVLTNPEMRLLIERDQHRGVCPGLNVCDDHPVPHVVAELGRYYVYRRGSVAHDSVAGTASAAMSAARALAVGE